MSAVMLTVRLAATMADTDHWTAEHLAELEAQQPPADAEGWVDAEDWVAGELHRVALAAAQAWAAARPDMFVVEPM